ncbi:MAG: T9SS type A sorting domain-containing protein [Bacteroidota bacterium]|nr:T9SS type A sorting domain-containing protein [Bacteroidota bacterium]
MMKKLLILIGLLGLNVSIANSQNSKALAPVEKVLTPDENGIIYVKQSGNGDGSSWTNATDDIQAAIFANTVEEVWVAEGTYYPSDTLPGETGSKMRSFQMKEGVHVYGNFKGTEASINERDIDFNNANNANTFLSTITESYHILVFDTTGYATETILDGFIITNGNADNIANPPHNFGGGVILSPNSIVRNCAIYENEAEIGGGAVLYKGGIIDSCIILNNSASHEAGGVAILYDGTVKNSTIYRNDSENRGAGIYVEGNTAFIQNCKIENNSSTDYGAGVYFRDVPIATIEGSYLINNEAGKSGGGLYAYNSSINIYNCTVVNNTASTGYGGGINTYNDASVNIINSVFIDNTAHSGDNIYKCSSGCTTTVSYSGIEGGYEGENNANITSADFSANYHIYDGVDEINPPSQCLNSGNNSILNTNIDMEGNPRLSFDIVDMGAFESTTCEAYQLTSTVTTGGGTATPEDTSIYLNNPLTYIIKPNTNAVLDEVLFNSVDVGDKLQVDGNNFTFTVDTVKTDGELNVSFSILPNVDITTSISDGGNISPTSANIEYGSSQVFSLAVNNGYEINEISYSGTAILTDNQDGTITLSEVTTSGELSVTLILKQYDITTSVNTGGSISPASATIEYDASKTFTLTFNDGYELDDATFSGNGNVIVNNDSTVTLNNVKSEGELNIVFTLISGIEIIDNELSVYPNPTKGLIKINSNNLLNSNSFTVLDIAGRVKHSGSFSENGEIDISNLNKGTYILRIKTSKEIKSIKFIKIQ